MLRYGISYLNVFFTLGLDVFSECLLEHDLHQNLKNQQSHAEYVLGGFVLVCLPR